MSGGLATVVLAAGAGTRFGGGKMLAEVDGRPLLSRVLDALDGVGETRVVVLGAAAEEVERAIPAPGWQVVVATDWARGPGASLRAGLAAAPTADAALIVLGDLAWLQPEAVARVLAAAESSAEAEYARAREGGSPGHPLLIRGALMAAARQAPDGGLRELLVAAPGVEVECRGLGACRDVDTVADLGTGGGRGRGPR